ncbi:MAG: twin-arginine translocation signal domain-containing protein [Rhizomicrobium sp.]
MSGQSTNFWQQVTGYTRGAIAVFLLLSISAAVNGAFLPTMIFVGLLCGAVSIYPFVRRQSLGWIIDERGERQKVEHVNRGQPIYSPTTHKQRVEQEAVVKADRRRDLLQMSAATAIAAGIAVGIFATKPFGVWWLAGGLAALAAISPLISALRLAAVEVVYQSGFQDIPGAKVLDPSPLRAGLGQVAEQKAHGSGRVASEEEALAALKSKR